MAPVVTACNFVTSCKNIGFQYLIKVTFLYFLSVKSKGVENGLKSKLASIYIQPASNRFLFFNDGLQSEHADAWMSSQDRSSISNPV